MRKTRDFARVIRRELAANRRLRMAVQRERLNAAIASLIYQARVRAKMTQKALAELVGTQQSVIARLEDADYTGHSLNMLQRIATALGRELTVGFEKLGRQKSQARTK